MKNYERYQNTDTDRVGRTDVLYHLCRKPSDGVIIPLLKSLTGKRILEVGIGSGYYTRYVMNGNKVCGIDQNPHLCQLPIKVYKGDAARLNEAIGEKNFDVVMSMWMTEYLNHEQLQTFLCQSRQMLSGGGMLLTTIIADKGMGILYFTAAKKLRHIANYCYNISVVEKMTRQAGFNSVEIKTLNARLGLSWAYLVSAQI